jgi:NitT/TauT family transport system permease protein
VARSSFGTAAAVAVETSPAAPLGAGARRGLLAVASIGLLVLVWYMASWWAADPRLLPGPARVGAELLRELANGNLPYHLGVTLGRVALSFIIAMSVGTAIGILMGRVRLADELGQPWLVFFLNLPALVTIVLCFIWIGLNEVAVIVAVAANKIPNVVVTVREGARSLDPALLEMARVFRFSRLSVLRDVVLPQLYSYLLAAARSGLALIWKIVLVVELLGRSSGVGFEIGTRFQLFDVAGILAYAIAFILIVQVIEWGVLRPIDARVNRWRRA